MPGPVPGPEDREESGTVFTIRKFRTQQKKPIFIIVIPGKEDRERIHIDLALKEFTV